MIGKIWFFDSKIYSWWTFYSDIFNSIDVVAFVVVVIVPIKKSSNTNKLIHNCNLESSSSVVEIEFSFNCNGQQRDGTIKL